MENNEDALALLPLIIVFAILALFVGGMYYKYDKVCGQNTEYCLNPQFSGWTDIPDECTCKYPQYKVCSCEERMQAIENEIYYINALTDNQEKRWYTKQPTELCTKQLPDNSQTPLNQNTGSQGVQTEVHYTPIGKLLPGNIPAVDAKQTKDRCIDIAEAVCYHETVHAQTNPQCGLNFINYGQSKYDLCMKNELSQAYPEERTFLEKRLAELKKKCQSWKCDCNQVIYSDEETCWHNCGANLKCFVHVCKQTNLYETAPTDVTPSQWEVAENNIPLNTDDLVAQWDQDDDTTNSEETG